jgi:hypothetical protein
MKDKEIALLIAQSDSDLPSETDDSFELSLESDSSMLEQTPHHVRVTSRSPKVPVMVKEVGGKELQMAVIFRPKPLPSIMRCMDLSMHLLKMHTHTHTPQYYISIRFLQ